MISAHDVAALLIKEQHTANRTVDKMQLQKLLYLVQGAHFEFWGDAAFREDMLAYRKGPVVGNVESTYRDVDDGWAGGDPSRVPDDVAETVGLVLSYFGSWSGPALERFVKQPGSPWRQARGDLPSSAASQEPIRNENISAWFRKHGVNPSPRRLTLTERALFDGMAAGDSGALTDLLGGS